MNILDSKYLEPDVRVAQITGVAEEDAFTDDQGREIDEKIALERVSLSSEAIWPVRFKRPKGWPTGKLHKLSTMYKWLVESINDPVVAKLVEDSKTISDVFNGLVGKFCLFESVEFTWERKGEDPITTNVEVIRKVFANRDEAIDHEMNDATGSVATTSVVTDFANLLQIYNALRPAIADDNVLRTQVGAAVGNGLTDDVWAKLLAS